MDTRYVWLYTSTHPRTWRTYWALPRKKEIHWWTSWRRISITSSWSRRGNATGYHRHLSTWPRSSTLKSSTKRCTSLVMPSTKRLSSKFVTDEYCKRHTLKIEVQWHLRGGQIGKQARKKRGLRPLFKKKQESNETDGRIFLIGMLSELLNYLCVQ